MESVEIDADENDGQVVEPAREIQVSDMVTAAPGPEKCRAIPGPHVAQFCSPTGISRQLKCPQPRRSRGRSRRESQVPCAQIYCEVKIECRVTTEAGSLFRQKQKRPRCRGGGKKGGKRWEDGKVKLASGIGVDQQQAPRVLQPLCFARRRDAAHKKGP